LFGHPRRVFAAANTSLTRTVRRRDRQDAPDLRQVLSSVSIDVVVDGLRKRHCDGDVGSFTDSINPRPQ
jgi:hypothetical protein